MKSEQSAETKLYKDAKKQHDQDGQECEYGRNQTEEKEKEHHPYKGTIIDYSG